MNEEKNEAVEPAFQEEAQEFFDYYAETNKKAFNPTKESIPDEVWQMQKSGMRLKDAYREHQNHVSFLKGFNGE